MTSPITIHRLTCDECHWRLEIVNNPPADPSAHVQAWARHHLKERQHELFSVTTYRDGVAPATVHWHQAKEGAMPTKLTPMSPVEADRLRALLEDVRAIVNGKSGFEVFSGQVMENIDYLNRTYPPLKERERKEEVSYIEL